MLNLAENQASLAVYSTLLIHGVVMGARVIASFLFVFEDFSYNKKILSKLHYVTRVPR